MPRKRSWSDDELRDAVSKSFSIRRVIIELKLVPAGGNYQQVQDRIKELALNTDHFTGKGWNVAWQYFDPRKPKMPLEELLVNGTRRQPHSLKKRLFNAGLKQKKCEICGWAQISPDGRIPIELDHINGDHYDNRLENLRILCPNCHSLQPTHRGRNKKIALKYRAIKNELL